MRAKQVFTLIVFGIVPFVANAGSLSAPFSSDSADVLPAGVRSLRVNTMTTETDTQYSDSGTFEGVGSALNQRLTWQKLGDGLASEIETASFLAYARHNNKNLQKKDFQANAVIGETFGDVKARVTATVPVFAYGLSDIWTTAIAVPVVYSKVRVTTGFVAFDNFRTFVNKMSEDGKRNKALEAQTKSAQAIDTKLTGQGYSPRYSRSKTEVGDVVWVNKFQVVKDKTVKVAVQPQVVFPTGKRASIHDPFDIGTGDGQFDVGLKGVADVRLSSTLNWVSSVGYTAQLPDKKSQRIPESPDSRTSPDVDQSTYRDLGDILAASSGVAYQVNFLDPGLIASTTYTYQYKEPDRYAGANQNIGGERYNYLEKETEQSMHAVRAGLGYSTVGRYLKGEFAIPFETNLGFTKVVGGRNVKVTDLASLELVMYF